MTTLYSILIDRCGLSHREAAEFHKVRPDTIKSWSAGRNRAPDGAIAELRALYRKIENAAGQMLTLLDSGPEDADLEIGIAADDHEARLLGWPCVGAQLASIGIAAARIDRPIRLVPRGATAATAAAADIHDASLRKSAD
jgi:hypothetical protein